jgi:small subunit ribosomal protein S3
MGQKVRPTGFRTGITRGWLSDWYAGKQDFAGLLVQDQCVRKVIKGRYRAAGISRIHIRRTPEGVVVRIHAALPAQVIGQQGSEVERLTRDIAELCQRHVEVQAVEVGCPERDAQLVAECVAEQLQSRRRFRRAMRGAVQTALEAGARGIQVRLAGRLAGGEVARVETARAGSLPLSTLRARIDHGFAEASTAQGRIGVQVWINNGDDPGATA